MRKDKAKSSFFEYFATPAGRRWAFRGACGTTLALFVGNFVPQTLGLSYYKEIVQSYNQGIERKISDKVYTRFETALDILKFEPYEQILLKPFTVYGFDVVTAGYLHSRFGAIFGIPNNYSYESASDIKKSEILFRNNPINWESEAGKNLEAALVLTNEEQLFSMCKSLLQLKTHNVLLNAVFPSMSFLTVYAIGNSLNIKMNLYARPFLLRGVMYGILGLFGMGLFSFMKDFNQVATDADVDKKLSALGPEFIEAGVTYYDKLLKKNIALRKLIGDDTYTALGNENFLIRQKSMPLTVRKSFFKDKLDELRKSIDTESPYA